MLKSPPHIAIYLPHLDQGGAERDMVHLATRFIQVGLRVDMLLVKAWGSYLASVPARVNIIDLEASNAYSSAPKLIRYLNSAEPDILYSALELTNLIALISKRICRKTTRVYIKIACTVSMHRRSRLKKSLERILLSQIYPWADGIVAISQGVKTDLSRYAGIPLNRIKVIYNPTITADLFKLATQPVSHPWFSKDRPPVILGAGRLTEQKDFPTLLKAFAIVRQQQPANLVILGEGQDRSKLQNLARTLGISNDVDFPGFVDNPYAYMSKAAVFVLSSKWEGLGNVLIEAMACGCPVVSTDCPSGPVEILDGGRHGHLFPPGNPEAMANAIVKVLSGDAPKPPLDWLRQFSIEEISRQHLNVMGISL